MVKPICKPIQSFDAKYSHTFYFETSNSIIKNKLIIRENYANTIVYEATINTTEKEQTLPAYTLVNGSYYSYSFIAYDSDGNNSVESNWVSFRCYGEPIIMFEDNNNDTITSTIYTIAFNINQPQDLPLDYALVYVYKGNTLVHTSNKIHCYEDLPYTLGYEYDNFETDNEYIIKVKATCIYGISNEKSIKINVDYSKNVTNPCTMELIENCNGFVEIKLHAISSISSLNYNKIILYRVENDKEDWKTIKEIDIDGNDDFNQTIYDCYTPSGVKVKYKLVPFSINNIKGQEISSTITPYWNKVFVIDCETNKVMSLYSGYALTNTSNKNIGTLQPLNAKYPIVIQNGNEDYDTISVSGNILNMDIDNLDRNEIVNITNEWTRFLKNGRSKVVKDWNGNIWIGKVNNSIPISYNQNLGNGLTSIAFNFVEEGKWNK